MTHKLSSSLKLLPLVPLAAFALSGCQSMDHNSAAAGPGTIVTVSHQPYKDLKAGHYNEARDGFSQDFAKYPDDPYVQLDLGLSYQMLGRMDQAEPLYRKALVGGGNITPADTTTKQSLGLNIASIACDNLKAGLKDPNACGAAPPPPPPPPMVKTFIVFFDFNKSNLTAEAQQVVASAVKTAKEAGAVRIMITGHTDTVGSHSYNQGLSDRRAQSTKDEMVHQGMDANEIMTAGKSFDDPLVPTGPGVREPQNRRAVIDLGAGAGT